ncbi:hypothetical protein ACFWHQ_08010 [Streptomyces sp. NPDC060334]|uniref:hypothetical protein n=1 Tax=unclassified Streptomyces TaxID=2593676 RepID=UPI0022543BB5|nr:hypothetical protein [Streptomyces sp. NBC_00424]MCX5077557.1 hypothetical protein [Streptomyces sp. NBC_00424]WUD39468.1 hypothetical protein OHA84_02645 [Streptomyces sp. NBC_00513]
MTTAKLPFSLRGAPEEEEQRDNFHSGATRIGKWMFTPPSTDRGETRNATPGAEGLEIDLRYSSSTFAAFLRAMSTIQDDFSRRPARAAAPDPALGERSGGSSRV